MNIALCHPAYISFTERERLRAVGYHVISTQGLPAGEPLRILLVDGPVPATKPGIVICPDGTRCQFKDYEAAVAVAAAWNAATRVESGDFHRSYTVESPS